MRRYERWTWWAGWVVLTLLRPLLFRLRVEGREHVPAAGGGVVVSNHNYGFDFILLAYSSPRDLHFMAKSEIFAWHPLVAWIMRAIGAFPVQRGKSDAVAIETAVALVQTGNLIAMFPEGTRSKDGKLMRGRTGAARIAMAADAPLLPVAVTGTPKLFKSFLFWRPQIVVRFGAPVVGVAPADDPEAARYLIDAAMGAIAALLPDALQGVYAPGYVAPEPVAEPSVAEPSVAEPSVAEVKPEG
jgi:1-acyl-sn-glycerol-3-phosphate acyltransferase